MALTRGLAQNDGVFESIDQMQETDLKTGLTVAVNNSTSIQWYKISSTGNGVLLTNGNYANPVSDPAIDNLKGLNANTQTVTSYQLLVTDFDAGEVRMDNASANTVSIPLDVTELLPERTVLVTQLGTGVTSIQAVAGVSLNGVDGGFVDINAQYSGAALTKIAPNTYIVTGNITEVA